MTRRFYTLKYVKITHLDLQYIYDLRSIHKLVKQNLWLTLES